MDARINLDAASRDELIALIVHLQAVIGRLERTHCVGVSPRPIGSCAPLQSEIVRAPKQSRRPHGFSRRRMTHRSRGGERAGPRCPGGRPDRTRGRSVDLPRVPAQVTELFIAREVVVPACRRQLPPPGGAGRGRQRTGGQPGQPDLDWSSLPQRSNGICAPSTLRLSVGAIVPIHRMARPGLRWRLIV